jgi:peptidyl-prolyl cis-trans isomerase A (cyclophilin A)
MQSTMKGFLALILVMALVLPLEAKKMSDKTYAVFKTSQGQIVCELFPNEAPLTVKNFVGLASGTQKWVNPMTNDAETKPLYSGTIFHRVIPKFMIQGGDPMGTGRGGPGYKFEDECTPKLKFDKVGRLAMANSGPNTNGSQFFITVAPTPWLDGHHTIFGQVVKGQDVADKISNADKDEYDRPSTAITLESVTITNKLP